MKQIYIYIYICIYTYVYIYMYIYIYIYNVGANTSMTVLDSRDNVSVLRAGTN